VSVTDASGRLTVEVPADWTDQSLALEGADFPNIQASTDLAAFRTGFEVPGTSFSLLPTPPAGGFDTVLDFLANSVNLPNACVSAGKDDYTDGVFTGRFEVWQECAGIGTQIVLIVASQADGQTIEINVQLPVGEPVDIVQHIAETFFIVG
jgi:serine protease Do